VTIGYIKNILELGVKALHIKNGFFQRGGESAVLTMPENSPGMKQQTIQHCNFFSDRKLK
jgi:hypothetical protein